MTTLNQRIDKAFTSQEGNGQEFLQVINAAIVQMADKAHDWDAAARILGKAGSNTTVDRVARMALGLYFGNRVKVEKTKEHYSGFRFSYIEGKWPDLAIAPSNHFAVFQNAVKDGASVYSPKLLKDMSDEIRGNRAAPTFSPEAYAKRIVTKLINEGVDLSVLEGQLETQWKQQAEAKKEALQEAKQLLVESLDKSLPKKKPVSKTTNIDDHKAA